MNKLSAVIFSLLLLLPSTLLARTNYQDPKSPYKTASEKSTEPPDRTNDSGLLDSPNDNGASETSNPEADREAQKLYESGMTLYDAGKLDEAIGVFKQSLKLRPEDPQTNYSLGMAYTQSKSYKDAAESFKRAVKYKPDWPEANFRVGMISYVLGHRTQSLSSYNKLRKLNSPLANALYRIINDDNGTALVAPNDIDDGTKPPKSGDMGASSAIGSATVDYTKTSEQRNDATQTPATEDQKSSEQSTNRIPPNTDTSAKSADPKAGPITGAPATPEGAVSEVPLTSVYRVDVGDVLDIRLLNSTTPRSTLFTVIDGGLIDFPVAGGPIAVAGLTQEEIQARIAAELKRRAVEDGAQISVGVRQFASHRVVVTGLVVNSGTRFLRREAVPLYVILAEVQSRLDAGRATIMRAGVAAQTIDLNDAAGLNTLVLAGDVINISARPQEFYYIAGRINYPGQKLFQSGITLLQSILAAGGLARENDDTVTLSREAYDGHLMSTKYSLREIRTGKVQDPKIRPGDRIEVLH